MKQIVSQGYLIPFKKPPNFNSIRVTPIQGVYKQVLLDEFQSLLSKGAIDQVQDQPQEGFYSMFF